MLFFLVLMMILLFFCVKDVSIFHSVNVFIFWMTGCYHFWVVNECYNFWSLGCYCYLRGCYYFVVYMITLLPLDYIIFLTQQTLSFCVLVFSVPDLISSFPPFLFLLKTWHTLTDRSSSTFLWLFQLFHGFEDQKLPEWF
jgi:hypothetical protein